MLTDHLRLDGRFFSTGGERVCGIAGTMEAGGAATGRVEAQLRTLRHRGPDATGVHEGRTATIGQTRLAVIDLVTGDPPITGGDGTVGVALNGEIYNFRTLRDELAGAGHRFRTSGDTEVVAHLAEDVEPVELASRLDGMFAVAVCDDRRGRLVLARDRLGKKPLYYWSGGSRLVFGSELKAVLAHPDVPRRLDPEAVPAYLTFGYVPSPGTFYEGVRSLPPGHVLVAEPGRAPAVARYWAPPLPDPVPDGARPVDLDEAAGRVRDLLSAAVARRLVADVPLGAFLSGGVDSSAVVATMAGLLDRPVRTFTIGFEDGDGFDERPYARLVAERFGTDHTEFVVRPDAVELVERLVDHYDEPFGDASAMPTFLLAELTRGHVTVALCGDGADELFAGYERFSAAALALSYRRLPAPARRGLEGAARAVPRHWFGGRAGSVRRFLGAAGEEALAGYLSWVRYLPGADGREQPCRAVQDYRRLWAESEGGHLVDRLLNLNLRTYLLDDLLPKVDRTSMAHGLEVRSPFLDTALVEHALRLPARLKLQGFSRKRVLRAAVRHLLPPAVLRRRKRGFAVPLDRWFRTDLAPYVEARLLAPSTRLHRHVDKAVVEGLWAEHQRGRADHGLALWALLTLEVFLTREGW